MQCPRRDFSWELVEKLFPTQRAGNNLAILRVGGRYNLAKAKKKKFL